MYTSTQFDSPNRNLGIGGKSLDALRVELMHMSSQQLQAFAQANQDDAIKLGLAAEADKYRKQHTQEAMAMMSGQQQKPPIAQQILQSIGQPPQQPQQPMRPQGQGMPPQGMPPQQMAQGQMPPQEMPPKGMASGGYTLPEDQGIATLPVSNMDFANGGIIAFGGGGDVPRFAEAGLVGQGFRRDQMLPPPTTNRNALIAGTMSDISAQSSQDELAKIETQLQSMPPSPQRDFLENRKRILLGNASATILPIAPAMAPALPANAMQAMSGMPTSASVGAPLGASNTPPSALPKSTAEPGLPAIAATKFDRTQLPSANVADTMRLYDNAMPKNIVDPLAKEREESNAPLIQAAARQVSAFEQEVQKRQPAFEDRLRKLDEKEARVNTIADRNLNMSLLEAGLAMMSGDSPHAFVNIGKGAQVGVKAFAEGQAKVEAARDKMEEARARIDEFRRNEEMMTGKERRAVLRDYDNTVAAASKDLFNGIQQQYGLKREDVRSAIAAQRAREDANAQIESRENLGIAGIRSNENIARAHMQNTRDVAKITAETYKLPMLYKQVEDSVDKQLAADINYKTADETTRAAMRDAALKKRLLATPGLAQYVPQDATGGSGGGLKYNPQTGKIE